MYETVIGGKYYGRGTTKMISGGKCHVPEQSEQQPEQPEDEPEPEQQSELQQPEVQPAEQQPEQQSELQPQVIKSAPGTIPGHFLLFWCLILQPLPHGLTAFFRERKNLLTQNFAFFVAEQAVPELRFHGAFVKINFLGIEHGNGGRHLKPKLSPASGEYIFIGKGMQRR